MQGARAGRVRAHELDQLGPPHCLGRAAVISWWRRGEESLASRTFGYRYTAAGWPEALLRWGTVGGERLLDETADLSAEPLIGEIAEWLRERGPRVASCSPVARCI